VVPWFGMPPRVDILKLPGWTRDEHGERRAGGTGARRRRLARRAVGHRARRRDELRRRRRDRRQASARPRRRAHRRARGAARVPALPRRPRPARHRRRARARAARVGARHARGDRALLRRDPRLRPGVVAGRDPLGRLDGPHGSRCTTSAISAGR
jgi:hypothetical protein